jgi:hypothetical protein
MKIFISYSRTDQAVAEGISAALLQERHDVFLDRDSLDAGTGFHAKIRASIQKSDLFIFLVSPASIRPESYAMAELDLARRRWNNPSGRVLPIKVKPTPQETLPPYLAAITVLDASSGSIVEVLSTVHRLESQVRTRNRKSAALIGLPIAILLTAGAILFGGGTTLGLGSAERQHRKIMLDSARKYPDSTGVNSVVRECKEGNLELAKQIAQLPEVAENIKGLKQSAFNDQITRSLLQNDRKTSRECLRLFKESGWSIDRPYTIPLSIAFDEHEKNGVVPVAVQALTKLYGSQRNRGTVNALENVHMNSLGAAIAVEDIQAVRALLEVGANSDSVVFVSKRESGQRAFSNSTSALQLAELTSSAESLRAALRK